MRLKQEFPLESYEWAQLFQRDSVLCGDTPTAGVQESRILSSRDTCFHVLAYGGSEHGRESGDCTVVVSHPGE